MISRRRYMGGVKGESWGGLRLTAVEDCVFTIKIQSNVGTNVYKYIEYSTDNGATWVKTDNVTNTEITVTIPTINAGSSVLLRGEGTGMSNANRLNVINSTGLFDASGKIVSLLLKDNYDATNYTVVANSMAGLFRESPIREAKDLIMGTKTGESTFQVAFYGCTNLISAPVLPATTLSSLRCYLGMFEGCSSLVTPPELPAENLVVECYHSMFKSCSSLESAPALPVTTLAASCYYLMFQYCTKLTTAPVLPALTLARSCYREMFSGCSKLNYVNAMATTLASDSTTAWLRGVSSTGTFVKNIDATSWSTGEAGIPSNWTVETA